MGVCDNRTLPTQKKPGAHTGLGRKDDRMDARLLATGDGLSFFRGG